MGDEALSWWESGVGDGTPLGEDVYCAVLDGTLRGDAATVRIIPVGTVDACSSALVEETRRAARRGVLAMEDTNWHLPAPPVVPLADRLNFTPDLPSPHCGIVRATTSASDGTFTVTRVRRIREAEGGGVAQIESIGRVLLENRFVLTLATLSHPLELAEKLSVVEIVNVTAEFDGRWIVDSIVCDEERNGKWIVSFKHRKEDLAGAAVANLTEGLYSEIWNPLMSPAPATIVNRGRIETRSLFHFVMNVPVQSYLPASPSVQQPQTHEAVATGLTVVVEPQQGRNRPSRPVSRAGTGVMAMEQTGSPRRSSRKKPPGFSRSYRTSTPQFTPPPNLNRAYDSKASSMMTVATPNQPLQVIQSSISPAVAAHESLPYQPVCDPDTAAAPSYSWPNVEQDRPLGLWPVPVTPPATTTPVVQGTEPLPQPRCVPDDSFVISHPMAKLQLTVTSPTNPMAPDVDLGPVNQTATPSVVRESTATGALPFEPPFTPTQATDTTQQTHDNLHALYDLSEATECPHCPEIKDDCGEAGQQNETLRFSNSSVNSVQDLQMGSKTDNIFQDMMTCSLEDVHDLEDCDPDKIKRAIDSVGDNIGDMVELAISCISLLPDTNKTYVRSLSMSFNRRLRERLCHAFVQQEYCLYLNPSKMAPAISKLVADTELNECQKGMILLQLFIELKKTASVWRFNLKGVRPENVPDELGKSLWTVRGDPIQLQSLDDQNRTSEVSFQNPSGDAQLMPPHFIESLCPVMTVHELVSKTNEEIVNYMEQVLMRSLPQLQQFLKHCMEISGRDNFLRMLERLDTTSQGAAGTTQLLGSETSTEVTGDSIQDFSFPPVRASGGSPAFEPSTFHLLSKVNQASSDILSSVSLDSPATPLTDRRMVDSLSIMRSPSAGNPDSRPAVAGTVSFRDAKKGERSADAEFSRQIGDCIITHGLERIIPAARDTGLTIDPTALHNICSGDYSRELENTIRTWSEKFWSAEEFSRETRVELIFSSELLVALNKSLRITKERGHEEAVCGLLSRVGALVKKFNEINIYSTDSMFRTFYGSFLMIKTISDIDAPLAFKLVFAI